MLRSLATFTFVTALAACAVDASDGSTTGAEGGKADGSEPTITFKADYTQKASGTLVAGSSVRVRYALDRLQDCRGTSGGSDQWGVSGYAKFDDGTETTFGLSNLVGGKTTAVDAELQIPAGASSVDLWFSINNRWGCSSYDSDYGNNYSFAIDRHGLGATLDFPGDGSFSPSGAVHAGDKVTVHYAPQRLQECQAETNGNAAWGITLHWQVDGGTVHDAYAARADGTSLTPADPVITVPRGGDLAMWFEATSIYGCHAYDSDSGANYHVAIE
jgi:uncharacterized protein YraI